jgi:F-type H+-transporting ATPase subunit a
LFSNWIGVLPLFGEGEFYILGHGEQGEVVHQNILRSANSDLNVTGAMALIVFVWTELLGLRAGGLAYLREFIWPGLGIEVISHVARAVALALRLFGNILAGEILLAIMSALVPIVIPALFLGFELFVGLVQALIFTLLTLAFMTLATEHEAVEHLAEGEPAHH